jgi:hypothetical protein
LQPNVVYDKSDSWGARFPGVMSDTGPEFIVTAELLTVLQGNTVVSISGYDRGNPLQGMLYIEATNGLSHYYPLPSSTGPAKIVSVNGSTLTLETLGGTYEKDEAGTGIKMGKVNAQGGSRYGFDLLTRTFK